MYPFLIFFLDDEYPPGVRQAWEDCMTIRSEQERYEGIKADLEDDLRDVKKNAKRLEDVRRTIEVKQHLCTSMVICLQELPKRISTQEESEVLSLLCKVHELEIEKVEMQSSSKVSRLKLATSRSICPASILAKSCRSLMILSSARLDRSMVLRYWVC